MWPGALHLFSQGGEVEAPQSPARPDAAAHARPHLRVTGPAPPDFRLPTGLLSMEICTERCTKGGVGDSVPLGSQSRPRRVPIAHRPGAPACLSGVAGDATSRNPSRFGLAPQTSASARWAQRSRNRSDVDFSRPKVSYQACPSTLRRSESESVCFSSGEEARMENAQACESNPLPAVSETSCTVHRGQNRSAYLTMGSRVKIDFQFCSPVLTPIEHRTRTPSQAFAEVAQSKNSFFVGGQREEKNSKSARRALGVCIRRGYCTDGMAIAEDKNTTVDGTRVEQDRQAGKMIAGQRNGDMRPDDTRATN